MLNQIGPGLAWHALSEREIFQKLESALKGLTQAQVLERQREFGPNTLPARKPPSVAVIFFHQFLSPLIYILLAAGVVAALIGDLADAAFILGVVLLNAAMGTFQEWKAEQSVTSLQRLLKIVARIRRDGTESEVAAEDLVPGDIVHLESGVRVPADLRLLQVNQLAVDESLLTGESVAVEKHTAALPDDLAAPEQRNMAFAGSVVASGRALGVVVTTGLRTEVGKIAGSVTAAETTKPPLVVRMERFARQISVIVLAACVLLGIVAFAQGMPAVQVFFLAVALAVSAIPEGLPVAMTVALSIATRRMAKRSVIVRKLTAVEGLGSCTYIASDKTGTLTINKQTAESVWLASGERLRVREGAVVTEEGQGPSPDTLERLRGAARTGALCNEATVTRRDGEWGFSGDAVDVALWELARKMNIDPRSVEVEALGQIPFESERGYAAKFFGAEGGIRVAIKGAPEVILALCDRMARPGGAAPLDRKLVDRELTRLSEGGHRVMAVAEGAVQGPPPSRGLDETDLPPLTLLGLFGLIDPARPEARAAVEKCRRAGIQVAMVTGDHPLTALAIARQVGIADSPQDVITGRELTAIGTPDVPEYLDRVKSARVFARVSPMQKLQIVDSLVKVGHFVAVTGDGVNDAPALKRANIGVAMGSGTDVAKDVASLIVADDNFASIEAGVEEGRFAYDNIRKVTYLLISTGAAEIVLFVLAIFSGMPLPLLPVQLLWLNLVTNGLQHLGLAFEAGEPGAMRRPPRSPAEGVFNKLMIQQTAISGAATGLIAFFNFHILFSIMGLPELEARNRLLLLMVLLENYHVFNCRSEYVSAFKVPLWRNWFLVAGVLAAQGIHILAMFLPPTQRMLRVGPISLGEWIVPFAIASSILVVMEVFKFWRRKTA